MRALQTTFRGFAPDQRGRDRPLECVYEVERVAAWRVLWGYFRGTFVLTLMVGGIIGLTAPLHGVYLPVAENNIERIAFGLALAAFVGIDMLVGRERRPQ